jgi:hypothetical protein
MIKTTPGKFYDVSFDISYATGQKYELSYERLEPLSWIHYFGIKRKIIKVKQIIENPWSNPICFKDVKLNSDCIIDCISIKRLNKMPKPFFKKFEYDKACKDSREQYEDGLIDLDEYNEQMALAHERHMKDSGCNK